MIAARKIESFCIDPEEVWVFAGNASGQISCISIDDFAIRHEFQAHVGTIQAIACHRRFPYIAALSTDRHVSVWRYSREGILSNVCQIPLRAVKPDNDTGDVPYVHSTSQALAFHDTLPRIATRSANGGLLELSFDDDGTIRILQCRRLHNDADLISTRYVKDSDAILSAALDGQFVMSLGTDVIRRWNIGNSNVHWAEHIGGTDYLLASDLRLVARLNIGVDDDLLIGEPFTRDDLEHVTYNNHSGRAYVASFDRTVYEVDPVTCGPVRLAFQAPFKCRWLKTLERSPSIAIVQCRNGGLYKACTESGRLLAAIRNTPDALWTAVREPNGTLILSGEGPFLTSLKPCCADATSRVVNFEVRKTRFELQDESYTKRMVRHPSAGTLLLGRTSGHIYAIDDASDNNSARLVADLGSAVRDLAFEPESSAIFAACEDGNAWKLDLHTGERLLSFRSPDGQAFWALAWNPERRALAIAQRKGSIFVVDGDDFSLQFTGIETARLKRMKWVNEDVLMYNLRDRIFRFDFAKGRRELLIDMVGNTIEDFIWDSNREYLVFVSYTQNIYLADFESGEILSTTPDQMDYSKGLAWISPPGEGAYPMDFVTYGRSGCAHQFRVHDEKILALGPVRSMGGAAQK
jgi:WD40 repeat protein